MLSYKTPGVYVEEIPTLPPSVVSVSTAVPAFIGYTEKGYPATKEEDSIAVKISSMLEFRALFGGPPSVKLKAIVTDNEDGSQEVTIEGPDSGGPEKLQYMLYYSLALYFANGGGPCYITSVGSTAQEAPAAADFTKGLEAIKKKDEPTLIVLTDAVSLSSSTDYHGLCAKVLTQCSELKDRFAIFDVLDTGAGASKDVDAFRNGFGMDDLKYGAAYFPYLKTSLNYHYKEEEVEVGGFGEGGGYYATDPDGIKITYDGPQDDEPRVKIQKSGDAIAFEISANNILTIEGIGEGKTPEEVVTAWKGHADKQGFDITINGSGTTDVVFVGTAAIDLAFSVVLSALKTDQTATYNAIKQALARETMTLPPSSAIAGIYAKVDRERGVWKAPANESLSSVIRPQHLITNEQQEGFNVDTTGKSINIIRSFRGKGTLVWGARTLAGNDNEWRYVSVRRLFNTIEESAQKATSFAVFESNDATTWLKVKTLIESYLYGLWQLGALAGPAPEQAYYVQVGLGKTMTTKDILEGRMNVEIGIAAVRPAEFIVLKFSHKLQEA